MKAPAFDYIRVATVADACAALVQHGPDARLLAGGQSLLPAMNLRLASPSVLIDIGRIHGLDGIDVRDGRLRIGALVRHETALRDAVIASHVPLLTEALPHVAHPAIRARGTIGGNLAHADPAEGVARFDRPDFRRGGLLTIDRCTSLTVVPLSPARLASARRWRWPTPAST